MDEKSTVLIVGAGPTGLVVAHELIREGVRCRLIDKSAHRATQSRAIAVHSRTVEAFELMGLADDFLAADHRADLSGERSRPFARSPMNSDRSGDPAPAIWRR